VSCVSSFALFLWTLTGEAKTHPNRDLGQPLSEDNLGRGSHGSAAVVRSNFLEHQKGWAAGNHCPREIFVEGKVAEEEIFTLKAKRMPQVMGG